MHPRVSRSVRGVRRLAGAAVTLGLLVATDPGTSAAVRPPKLDYTMTTLPNGLQVVFLEDHSTPIVHTEIWYHVGSKNEKPGRTGFAHLFEHMMFKGSKNVEPEGHPSYISSVGGQSNAYTNEDSTVFWETTPAQYLPLVLWLEADRMASLRIDEQVFKTEREVVKEERRMRVENQPYGRLNEIIYDQAFTVHPYKHPTIGSMTDLEAASIEDVRDFFRTYYVPNNATLVLVGDFDTKEALGLVTQYLGRVPKSAKPVPRDIPEGAAADRGAAGQARRRPGRCRRSSSPTTSPTTATRTRIRCTSPRRCCRTARARASIATSSTPSRSRWPRSAAATSSRIPNLFFAVAIVQPGKTPQECIDALIAEFDKLKAEPISANELQQAKNQFARDYILGRESDKDKAAAARARRRHPQRHQDRRRRVRHLHEHDGRRRPARREDLLHPREPARDDDHAQGRRVAAGSADAVASVRRLTMATFVFAAVCPLSAPAQVRDWPSERPPRPLPAREVKFPPYSVQTLPNGLQVIAVSQNEQPAVSLRLIVRAGGAQDPADKPGVATLAAALLDQGTTTRDAEQIASAIDSIGGALGTGAGSDLSFVQAVVMKDSLGLALDMVSDLVAPSGVRAGRDRASASADALGAEGQLRRSRLPRRRRVRSAGVRRPSRTGAPIPARRRRLPASRARTCSRSTRPGTAPTTPSSRSSAT